MSRSIVLHGHYYQPPREDPWLEEIARQVTAAPYHDWNERIERECYRAVTAARVVHVGAAPGHAATVTTRASGSAATGATTQAVSHGSVAAPTPVTTRAS